jgi:hypothetical protein
MTLDDRIADSIRRNPDRKNWEIAKNFKGVSTVDVERVRVAMGKGAPSTSKTASRKDSVEEAAESPSFKIAGISLSNRSVLSRRPAESAAKYLRKLANGKAYATSDLAKAWGMSEETIRKHARDLGCLKFVEVEADDWKPMVMNPETAKQFHI